MTRKQASETRKRSAINSSKARSRTPISVLMSGASSCRPSLLRKEFRRGEGVAGFDIFGRVLIDMIIKHQKRKSHEPRSLFAKVKMAQAVA